MEKSYQATDLTLPGSTSRIYKKVYLSNTAKNKTKKETENQPEKRMSYLHRNSNKISS